MSVPLDGELFHFDLRTIFRCAVELGAALHDQPDGAASPEAEIAGKRLRHVLNPHNAVFPSNFAWEEFRAMQEAGMPWIRGKEPRPGWKQELDLSDTCPAARQALLTIGLALADLRGDTRWHRRGEELLSPGTWNLWTGMEFEDREAIRHLLSDTHRVWGWPADPAEEPEPFTGPVATLSDYRILNSSWCTATNADLDAMQQEFLASNFAVDNIDLGNGRCFPLYRLDCKPSNAALPAICPRAMPKPPVELRPEGDLLAHIEARYRSLGLIGKDQSLHWVGRQNTIESTCTCDLAFPRNEPRSAESQNLRQLRQAIVELIAFVHGRYERVLGPGELHQLDRLGERVNALTRAVGMELPKFPLPCGDESLRAYGPTSVPLWVTQDGNIPSPRAGRLWESEWRAVRIAVEARLSTLDPCTLPCEAPEPPSDDRVLPMEAPAGTPSPLREAYEDVAKALCQAATMCRRVPADHSLFNDEARSLSAAWQKATESYALAELALKAESDGNGDCAHQHALTAISRVNEACGHIMRGTEPFHRATANIRALPAFDAAALLEAMRSQTSRAAMGLQRAAAPSASGGMDRWEARVEKARARREEREAREAQWEKLTANRNRFLAAVAAVRLHTLQRLYETANSVVLSTDNDIERFWQLWLDRWIDLGREINATSLRGALAQLKTRSTMIASAPNREATVDALEFLELACDEDRELLTKRMRGLLEADSELAALFRFQLHDVCFDLIKEYDRVHIGTHDTSETTDSAPLVSDSEPPKAEPLTTAPAPDSSQPTIASSLDHASKPGPMECLEPADRKAYWSFQYAQTLAGRNLEDREAYDLLSDRGIEESATSGELAEYRLPAFDTWSRQLRNARKLLGEQKYNRRKGRTGRSIAGSDDI
jgi:hypothetical protein